MKSDKIENILKANGIVMECESPLELRDKETGDTATGWLAEVVIEDLAKYYLIKA